MKKTIYNVYVVMESQEQCTNLENTIKQYKLPCIHEFRMFTKKWNIFEYCDEFKTFGLWTSNDNQTKVTEQEFIELLKEYKNAEKTNS